jgi:hypothetical protein
MSEIQPNDANSSIYGMESRRTKFIALIAVYKL